MKSLLLNASTLTHEEGNSFHTDVRLLQNFCLVEPSAHLAVSQVMLVSRRNPASKTSEVQPHRRLELAGRCQVLRGNLSKGAERLERINRIQREVRAESVPGHCTGAQGVG